MDSDDDDMIFSAPEESHSPIPQTKLKRLKKAFRVSSNLSPVQPLDSTPSIANLDPLYGVDLHEEDRKIVDLEKPTDPSIGHLSNSEGVDEAGDSDPLDGVDFHEDDWKTLDLEKTADSISPISNSEGVDEAGDASILFDDLFSDKDLFNHGKSSDMEPEMHLGAFGSVSEAFEGEGDFGRKEWGESMDIFKMGKSKKKRSLEGVEVKEKKNKKRVKSRGDGAEAEAPVKTKRKLEKERKAYLEQIHAESQRLLRETRDASFKSIPLVQKPISSVLEKIRRRKLELSKKAGIFYESNCLVDTYGSSRDGTQNNDLEHVESEGREDCENAEVDRGENVVNIESCDVDATDVKESNASANHLDHDENIISNMISDEESKSAFRTPINDTEELFCGSQYSDGDDGQPKDDVDTPQEDVFAPSLLAMNLKLDSVPLDDNFSDKDDDDKENVDPHPCNLVDLDSYPKGDPVKAFVDDEAEEEDDSDNDLMRFQENEEDEENEINEEFDDLIATGYEEMPLDCEKRDELHQKWLEQQDAAATDNVLQRLKCGWKQRDTTVLHDEEDDEEFGDDSVGEAEDDLLPANVARNNSKKAKQMIAKMFTDREDGFLHSDDEETEQRLVRQRLLEKTEEQASFSSPVEDESSREVFGLIKKLNIAPEARKRAKATPSFFDMLVTGGNSNSSSKSSFLSRTHSNSLPSSHKQGSSTVRSFIFGRDDSNSTSGISTSEISSDTDQKENHPPRTATAKFSNSQSKSSGNSPKIMAETGSGSSLFEILRLSSTNNCHSSSQAVGQTQAFYQFAAFKSTKKVVKM